MEVVAVVVAVVAVSFGSLLCLPPNLFPYHVHHLDAVVMLRHAVQQPLRFVVPYNGISVLAMLA